MTNLIIQPNATAVATYEGPQHQLLGTYVHEALTLLGNRSKDTARSYYAAVGQFLEHLGNYAQPTKDGRKTVWEFRGSTAVLADVTAADLDSFYASLTESVTISTAATRLYGVRAFLGVALRDGLITTEAAHMMGVTPYKQKRTVNHQPNGRRLSREEVRKLRAAAAGDELKAWRDIAILDCMLFAGLRRAEAAKLDVGHIIRDRGAYYLEVDGKGNKRRRVKVAKALQQSLTKWIDKSGRTLLHNGPIFENVDRWGNVTGSRINGATIGRLVGEYGFAAGIAAERGRFVLSAHDLRRTAARNAYDNGASLIQVQAMLGHSDPKTTARYIGVDVDSAAAAVDLIDYS